MFHPRGVRLLRLNLLAHEPETFTETVRAKFCSASKPAVAPKPLVKDAVIIMGTCNEVYDAKMRALRMGLESAVNL